VSLWCLVKISFFFFSPPFFSPPSPAQSFGTSGRHYALL
jgi:hypothetical protein